MLDRHDLTDEEWARLAPWLPSMAPQRGGRWVDHRMVINGIFRGTIDVATIKIWIRDPVRHDPSDTP